VKIYSLLVTKVDVFGFLEEQLRFSH